MYPDLLARLCVRSGRLPPTLQPRVRRGPGLPQRSRVRAGHFRAVIFETGCERPMLLRPSDAARDYSTISPSALSLLLMKSGSSIAFAKQAAALLWRDGTIPDELAHAMTEENARRRLRHFENRYRSLDRLLAQAACPNVLEIGSGLSFRGLELARTSPTHYVDTDLPALASLKAELVASASPRATRRNAARSGARRARQRGLPAHGRGDPRRKTGDRQRGTARIPERTREGAARRQRARCTQRARR